MDFLVAISPPTTRCKCCTSFCYAPDIGHALSYIILNWLLLTFFSYIVLAEVVLKMGNMVKWVLHINAFPYLFILFYFFGFISSLFLFFSSSLLSVSAWEPKQDVQGGLQLVTNHKGKRTGGAHQEKIMKKNKGWKHVICPQNIMLLLCFLAQSCWHCGCFQTAMC